MLTNRMVDNRVAKIEELEAMIKELEAKIESIKEELKNDMEEKGIDVINTGKYVVRYKEVVTARFDSNRFKKDHNDLYIAYLKDSVSKRFTHNAA